MPQPPLAVASAADAVDAADQRHAWHPFTQMQEYADHPRLHVARAEGCWLVDGAGKRYLDGNASMWTNVHGHNDPDLNQALRDQLNQVAHVTLLGLNHPTASALAEQLAGLTGGVLSRCFFTDNGSNAIEVALKLSFQYWQLVGKPEKQRVISFRGAYHGDTFGTMAVGDRGSFHERFSPWLFTAEQVVAPEHVECAGHITTSNESISLQALATQLQQGAGQTACVILEPRVQGAAGMKQQPAGFVRKVSELCRRHGVHFILDEVFTGFGRVGTLTVAEAEGITPDFLCLAKGLSAGYLPLAATLTSDAIYEPFLGAHSKNRTFFHGHTFSGNPLGCAVALESLRKLRPLLASGRPAECAASLGQGLLSEFASDSSVSGVRQFGLTAAVDFAAASGKLSWPIDARMGYRICLAARQHGLVIRQLGDSVLIVPPISIKPDEVKHLISALRKATTDVLSAI